MDDREFIQGGRFTSHNYFFGISKKNRNVTVPQRLLLKIQTKITGGKNTAGKCEKILWRNFDLRKFTFWGNFVCFTFFENFFQAKSKKS